MGATVELEAWHDLFVASAGAAAALAGLIIVSMSVNIKQILATTSMPSRAGSSIAALVLVVVVSIGALIPIQAEWMLGLESLVFGLIALAFAVDSTVRLTQESTHPDAGGYRRPLSNLVVNGAMSVLQVVPFVVGGVLLVVGGGLAAGLSWIAAGILFVIIGAVVNAWVMLVEILR
ncbi:hypothetical protein [Subtercola endophyticus]|uniref:hypothetical protein n=1 Tax=Subtercola endophyticus TaxID=2895559 RepID=UPI001E5F83F8|nr:hypothetical protein [Subtercola endophyticus]UFS61002.1 hypothetical protein LQ955_09835 [Subtercola endophyticus]